MDFREFAKNSGAKAKPACDVPKSTERELEAFAAQYENASEEKVVSDLMKMTREGKANGTFDMSQIEQFAGNLSAFLDDNQRQRMEEILSMMKKD